ncbi:MAG TPA: DUF2802 domain-containing protein [Dyella sp.]|uniref:DUF2802 domain-containing protein n=1 Tax=Dyella sp. TaxID=1869338 RepID=UPI002F92B4E1
MGMEIGLIALILLVTAQGVLLYWIWRQQLRLRVQLAQCLSAAGTDVPTSMLVMMLGRLERRLDGVERHLERHGAHIPLPPPSAQMFVLAQQLAREGVSVDELVRRCGLSRDEAELVRRMHGSGDVE